MSRKNCELSFPLIMLFTLNYKINHLKVCVFWVKQNLVRNISIASSLFQRKERFENEERVFFGLTFWKRATSFFSRQTIKCSAVNSDFIIIIRATTFIAQGGAENEARTIVARSGVSSFARRVNLPNIMEIYSCELCRCNGFQHVRETCARIVNIAACAWASKVKK